MPRARQKQDKGRWTQRKRENRTTPRIWEHPGRRQQRIADLWLWFSGRRLCGGFGCGWLSRSCGGFCWIGLIVELDDVRSNVDTVGDVDRSALRRGIKDCGVGVFTGVAIENIHHFAADAFDHFLLRSIDVFLIVLLFALNLLL